jgi:hypothetical protein
MVDVSISSGSGPAAGNRLVVFTDVAAAPALVGSGVTRPLALLVRLAAGRLIEIDLGQNDEGVGMTEGDRSLLPASSSALILTDAAWQELDELLQRWDHEVHPLSNQNQIDQE